ncbi:uncharacterized protein LOC128997417 [Macrosteles quadrilineatus]|uniref:uncharacterized protein LOC128997417 n=1 Tax=Macrosteles quadrilineatus TaxID=74068 RepID=UPI0023E34116|nr:uncharacterized protein LOC128997417 [Macrosteles quadrilineatus]
MFRFPNSPLADIWTINCGNPLLIGFSPKKLNRIKVVCEKHFPKEAILPSGRLIRGSVPYPYAADSEVEDPSVVADSEVEDPSVVQSPDVHLSRSICSPRRYPGRPQTDIMASPAVSTSSATFEIEQSPSVRQWIVNASPQASRFVGRSNLQTVRKTLFESPSKKRIQENLTRKKKQLASKMATISALKRQIRKLKHFKPTLQNITAGLKSKAAATLFGMQLHKKRQAWKKDEMKFAIELYLRSPAAYRFLAKKITLPGISTQVI